MTIVDNNTVWEAIGTVVVDSGQLMVVDPSYIDGHWVNEPFQDVRIYQHKQTGEKLQFKKDFGNYEAPIAAHGGKTMNQLNATGEWEQLPRPESDTLSYNGACSATLSDKGAGVFGRLATAFSTGYGDGEYTVYASRDEEGRIMKVLIDFDDD